MQRTMIKDMRTVKLRRISNMRYCLWLSEENFWQLTQRLKTEKTFDINKNKHCVNQVFISETWKQKTATEINLDFTDY